MKFRMRNTLAACTAIALLQLTAIGRAEAPPAATAQQIEHLIEFIRSSPCVFVRNGTDYDGEAAVAHIQQKYEHYRDQIHSAEDFIDLTATKSMISGRPYEVRCPGQDSAPAAEWLREELKVYRAKPAAD